MAPTLLDWLVKSLPTASRQTLKRMVQDGRIVINGRSARGLTQPLDDRDRVAILPRGGAGAQAADGKAARTASKSGQHRANLKVVYEDADILVVDKPPGLLTSTVAREKRPTLWAIARQYVADREPRARVGLIHRLDRDASGLLIFSKNDAAYQSLKSQFFHHDVHRQYAAIAHGTPRPPEGRIETHLVERADGTVHSTRQAGRGMRAITDYRAVALHRGHALIEVILQTGRKHQIRVHLREKGWPIAGDTVYGTPDGFTRLMLAATELQIDHPRTRERMHFNIASPWQFELAVDQAMAAKKTKSSMGRQT